MTRSAMVAVALMAVSASCARRPPETVAPQPRDLVVLAPDPETNEVGHLTVTTAAGQVELSRAGESTVVAVGQAPGPVAVLDEATIESIFGTALAGLPAGADRFELYFETGGDTLAAESTALVPEVIVRARARTVPEVSIIGHTDTTGTAESNVTLGMSRASRIRDLLVEAGLDPILIEVVSHGESDLVVPTPDDTPEARNRRVEVTIR